ncbi:uncharacterized protein [Coffea arabica]|uniref:Uncharacterized protein n=1 Tax=Coffea arabica TaxID=13443 RepID=A0ABM4WYS0_COFAR
MKDQTKGFSGMWGKFRLAVNTTIDLAKQLPLWRGARPIPPELPTAQVEPGGAVSETEDPQPARLVEQQQPDDSHHDRAQIDNVMNMQWGLLVIGACFAAISVILQALQTRATLPVASTFPWFCMAFELAFLALLVSVYMRRHYHKASLVMEHVAIFFCAVALLLAIWMNLDPPFKQMSAALFFIGFTIIIILANRSLPDWV